MSGGRDVEGYGLALFTGEMVLLPTSYCLLPYGLAGLMEEGALPQFCGDWRVPVVKRWLRTRA